MKKGPITPKGFRDINPKLAIKRRRAINRIAEVLESFGFLPIETPTVEFAETLLGKYGKEEKLIYQFTDRGGRKLALRYDLTVPLARFVANNLDLLRPSFSRYQIGSVFRGEKPQRGRFREFVQFDFDIVGSSDTYEEDAKIIAAAIKSARGLGLEKAIMAINDRKNFEGLPMEAVRAWDKLYKIGLDGVKKELSTKGFSESEIEKFIGTLDKKRKTENFNKVREILESKYDLRFGTDFVLDNTLARGLDYYTGLVFELKPSGKQGDLSIGGGGRYDNLIGTFAGRNIPAVGFSFGLDRLVELI
ncbi:histidine--tRNA ligase [Patescibacteria group bacterium]|nr:histidine--tRNA ligase [Patescibacteria group bacterium]MBU0777143.1 histidine--tRNA ligase [Patescibacteria group bacterium]MBU0845837.1 histidine--tRNA ligase [Patescibacteria group bacterium]MBU0922864.1 histidine--tRNA ligase [Patescibacteria group bacterium]MBU1066403.1 histidine--tRNA ligase [Patescibacteria group bacterium]